MIRPFLALFLSAAMLQEPVTIRVNVQLQQVIVTVRDAEGSLVKNLKVDDFTLEEDGVPQEVVHFTQDTDTPVTLGLLVDRSGSMANVAPGYITGLRAAEGAARVLLRLMKPGDEYMLMSFADNYQVDQNPTTDPKKIEAALKKLKAAGSTNLFRAAEEAFKELRRAKHRKKALIIFTDAFAAGDYERLTRAIHESEVLIYTFGIRTENGQQAFGPGGGFGIPMPAAPPLTQGRGGAGPFPSPVMGTSMPFGGMPGGGFNEAEAQKLLNTLARESGGRSVIFEMNSDELINRMVSFVQDVAAELKGQYTLGYYPSNSGELGNHIVRIKSKAPNLRVRFRQDTPGKE